MASQICSENVRPRLATTELSWRYFFNVPEPYLPLKKVLSTLTSLSGFTLVFLFSCSPRDLKSSIVPSRGANLGTSFSMLFL